MFKITYYYLLRNKLIALLILSALTITFYFPILSNTLSSVLYEQMMVRAKETPLIVTAKGSRFLSVLNTIYFRTETLEPIPYSTYESLSRKKNILVIPIYNEFTAKVATTGDEFESIPVVSTSHEYFDFRDLEVVEGDPFLFPGEIVIGHKLAKNSGIQIGDSLLSEVSSIMNLNAIYPLKLKVCGILAESGTEDDNMIFSDLKSSWIMAGFFHGHENTEKLGEQYVLSEDENIRVMKKNVMTHNEITEDNVDEFHYHGEEKDLPLSSIIVLPETEKAAVITAGRINAQGKFKAYQPKEVMEEFFSLVFAVHKIFNAYFLLMVTSVVCFIAIIILLSIRLRKDEFETIQRIGGSRFIVLKLYLCEYGLHLSLAILLATGLSAVSISILQSLYL